MKERSERKNANTSVDTKPSILNELMSLQNNFRREILDLDKKRQEAVDRFVSDSLNAIQNHHNEVVDKDFEENKLITAKEAAEFLGCTQDQIYQYIHRNLITPVRINNRTVRFRKKDLRAFATGM